MDLFFLRALQGLLLLLTKDSSIQCFARSSKGLQNLLERECLDLGLDQVRVVDQGVFFKASWPLIYKALLSLQIASKVLMPIASGTVKTYDDLYSECTSVSWEDYLDTSKSFKILAETKRSSLDHSKFASLRVKDAIVDYFKARFGDRPSVEKAHPDVQLDLHIKKDRFTLSLDLCGAPLHERNLRVISGDAPIKEQLADACLMWAEWQKIYEEGGVFMDPCCGSGTFLLESIRIAQGLPAQFNRADFALFKWKAFNESCWSEAQEDLYQNRQEISGRRFIGLDLNYKAIERSSRNLERVSWHKYSEFLHNDLACFDWKKLFQENKKGLILCNPPYGERLKGKQKKSLHALYKSLGDVYKNFPKGWRMGVIGSDDQLLAQIGMPQKGKGRARNFPVFNGKIPCRFMLSATK